MNRVIMGLALGGGYVLGRMKKAKFAFAVGTLVAGKRMKLDPQALTELVSKQLESNPQFKALGEQLRENVRGVGKAATASLVTRRLESVAERLHDRTLGVQDRLSEVGDVAPEATAPVKDAATRVTGRRGKQTADESAETDETDETTETAGPDKASEKTPKTQESSKEEDGAPDEHRNGKQQRPAAKSRPRRGEETPSTPRGSARRTVSSRTQGGRHNG
ncbi:DNA primase [Streptomyces sp. SID14478]|uniref:DNA primase n=1 Tax=Streptomyces sp. SID14478 TaxID=2706073 RepID=UPI0013DAAFB4|nr:DNA primase [Streptomyces sp. SID14478]NEB79118.1 DNA primase [Streptomyces sp. SID14478]